ncbi:MULTISPECIES: hypothetical protein [unclassified Rhizobium]|uniref:hypothetical protein n=1 Tax=unclassified Rhizobium TaxID=2613769 RepID=UPI00119D938C|nr:MULTISPECIES: hypothetical protein [unclassified Rhizobium]
MAHDLVAGSIVTKAHARFLEQVLVAVNQDTIQPLRDALAHVTQHLATFCEYHPEEMTCDIAAALHNARALSKEKYHDNA